ncbi:hypothetical protein GCM10009826_30290 [Humibacillus xanthopallidus]
MTTRPLEECTRVTTRPLEECTRVTTRPLDEEGAPERGLPGVGSGIGDGHRAPESERDGIRPSTLHAASGCRRPTRPLTPRAMTGAEAPPNATPQRREPATPKGVTGSR